VAGCKKTEDAATAPSGTSAGTPEPAATQPATEEPKEPTEPAEATGPLTVEGLSTPESVLYDPETDTYLVSNINGSPVEKDDNGFISRVSPDGTIAALKWIDGSTEPVTLNAPKGLAIVGTVLYVADIDTVRMFDRKSGEPRGEVAIDGASFLNDVSAHGGDVFVSDSGLSAGKGGLAPAGNDAIYKLAGGGPPEAIIKGKELGNPNGIVATDDGVWVVTYGANQLYRVTADGSRTDVTELPAGSLDGLVITPKGDMLVSSWQAKAVFRGKPGATFEPAVSDVPSPADIGYDTKRNRVLIPVFTGNQVRIQPLP
jgi:sugar lactone lactonase YvrE